MRKFEIKERYQSCGPGYTMYVTSHLCHCIRHMKQLTSYNHNICMKASAAVQ